MNRIYSRVKFIILIVFLLIGCGPSQLETENQPSIDMQPAQPLQASQGWTIGLDPGHGWQGAPGATGNGLFEKTVTLDIATRAKAILESRGFKVVMTRSGDDPHDLTQAAKVINAENPDIVVSIHANSGGAGSTASGTEACHTVGKSTDEESRRLATLLVDSIATKLSLTNRGIFPENSDSRCARTKSTGWKQLYIHDMRPPTALIETGFLSSLVDSELLKNRSEDFALAIADAVVAYFQNTGAPTTSPPVVTAPTNPPVSPAVSTGTSTILVFDTSGSMEDPDGNGVQKLAAAKQAGIKLLDIIGAENQSDALANHQISVVSFGDVGTVNLPPTADISSAYSALDDLYAFGGTNMPVGLQMALELFPQNIADKSFIILLGDGQPNITLSGVQDEAAARQEVLDLAQQAGGRGICVYTVGFGEPSSGSIDESFLTDVAFKSHCGEYHNAQNAWELANIYINLRHASTGTALLQNSGNISQGETVNISDVNMPDNQSMFLFTLNWPGSQLDAILTDPNGRLIDEGYPGASITITDTLVSIIVQDPQPGMWNISALGVDVPEQTTIYNAVLSARLNPNPPIPQAAVIQPASMPVSAGFPFAIITIVLAAVGVMIYAFTISSKRARQVRLESGATALLVGLSGPFAGRTIVLKDGILIGRSIVCAIRLLDPGVSRIHARFRFARGRWYVQDINSKSGIYVNGTKVRAIALNKGDHIRIGRNEIEYR